MDSEFKIFLDKGGKLFLISFIYPNSNMYYMQGTVLGLRNSLKHIAHVEDLCMWQTEVNSDMGKLVEEATNF